jgi:hypothetical protein
MEDTVDQQNDVELAGRAFHVAARCGWKVEDVFDRRTVVRRQRGAGEDRQMTRSQHARHLAEHDALT